MIHTKSDTLFEKRAKKCHLPPYRLKQSADEPSLKNEKGPQHHMPRPKKSLTLKSLVAWPNRAQPLQDIDCIGQLVVFLTQFRRSFRLLAVSFDLADFVL